MEGAEEPNHTNHSLLSVETNEIKYGINAELRLGFRRPWYLWRLNICFKMFQ